MSSQKRISFRLEDLQYKEDTKECRRPLKGGKHVLPWASYLQQGIDKSGKTFKPRAHSRCVKKNAEFPYLVYNVNRGGYCCLADPPSAQVYLEDTDYFLYQLLHNASEDIQGSHLKAYKNALETYFRPIFSRAVMPKAKEDH